MSCPPCNQHCRQGRNCQRARINMPAPRTRIASAITDAMTALMAVALVIILGFGSGVLFWAVSRSVA